MEVARTAGWLRSAGFTPNRVLVSPALRARATWQCAEPIFPNARSELRDRLYLASTEVIMEIVDTVQAEADTVMVVGHNPGLQELGLRLAEASQAPAAQVTRIGDGFPTASACVFLVRPGGGGVLTAIYEPPRAPGAAPGWAFLDGASGGPA
jgi:phosphohistidine phosphatase